MNEVHLDASSSWGTAIGFDQFSKDAINYAYHDILNAEMEWPFLHQSATITTTPGVQFYTPSLTVPSGFTSPAELKEIDWNSFYIDTNETKTTISNELQTISSGSPYSISVTNLSSWQTDLGVAYNIGGASLTATTGDPAAGQYTVIAGKYYFNSTDANKVVKVSYLKATSPTQAALINPAHLQYIEYDVWLNGLLGTDLTDAPAGGSIPLYVFKTQKSGEIGLTPLPDKIYSVLFEYWLDPLSLSAATDVPLIPSRFNQVLLDGASKYCYEFREDPQMAKVADDRFNKGLMRMRVELINKDFSIRAGFNWPRSGSSWTRVLLTPNPR